MANDIKQRLRTINAVGAAAVVALLASTAVFGVVPLYRTGAQSINDSRNLTRQLKELDSLSLQVARVEVEKSSRETRLAAAENRLLGANGMNQFVQELARVAEESGLQVDAVTPSKELKDAGAYKLMTVHVTGTGDWATCYRFLGGLRGENRKLARLDNLTLENIKDKPADRPVCHISVDVSTFIMR